MMRFAESKRTSATSSLLRLNRTIRLREKPAEQLPQAADAQPTLRELIRMQEHAPRSRSSSRSSLASVASTRSLRASSRSPIRTSGPARWTGRSFGLPPSPSGTGAKGAGVEARLDPTMERTARLLSPVYQAMPPARQASGHMTAHGARCSDQHLMLAAHRKDHPHTARLDASEVICGTALFAPGTGPSVSSVLGHNPGSTAPSSPTQSDHEESHTTSARRSLRSSLASSASLRCLKTVAWDDLPEINCYVSSTRAPSSNASDQGDGSSDGDCNEIAASGTPVFSPMPAPPPAVLAQRKGVVRKPARLQAPKLASALHQHDGERAMEAIVMQNDQRVARLRSSLSEVCLRGRFVQAPRFAN